MPALVPQPQVLQVVHHFVVSDDLNVSTKLHFKYSGTAPADASCIDIASAFRSAWNNAWLGHLVNESSHEGVSVTDLTTPTSGFGQSLIHTLGTANPPGVPAGTALLVNYSIARRYRGGKPRSYWPLMVAADLASSSSWILATLATMTSEWQTSYLDAMIGSTIDGCVIGEQVNVSYYEGFTTPPVAPGRRAKNISTPRAVAITPDPITAFVINPKPASQRRRNLHSS